MQSADAQLVFWTARAALLQSVTPVDKGCAAPPLPLALPLVGLRQRLPLRLPASAAGEQRDGILSDKSRL